MTKNESKNKELISDVVGLRKSDNLLIIGRNIPFLKEYVSTCVHYVNSEDVGYKHIYDKIIVNDISLTIDMFSKLCCISTGLIVVMERDGEHRSKVANRIETDWWPADVWDLKSSLGPCLVTTAKGQRNKVSTEVVIDG